MSTDQIFRDHAISFHYPAGWELSNEIREDGPMITVTDGNAFWTLTMLRKRPTVDEVIRETVRAFHEEYDDLDEHRSEVTIARRKAVAIEMEFVYLELINQVYLRFFRTGRFTAFIMYQMTDHERETYEPMFELINDTLDCDLDGDIVIA